MAFEIRSMQPSLRDDFLRLHSEENGCGWCRCVAWWVPSWDGWGERTAAENLALREALFARGEHDGYLLYEDGEPLAWCQVGLRDRLAKLAAQLERGPEPGVVALSCFLVAPRARGRGVARALLAGVLEDLEARREAEGLRAVEAYPRVVEDEVGRADPLDLWNGPESLFLAAGFRPLGRVGPRRVLRFELGAGD